MKKIKIMSLIVVFTIILLSNNFVNAQQHITTNTIWNTDQIITQPIIIDSGVVLTINEGVQVQTVFVDVNADQIGDVYIEVNGKLNINGSPCNPVVFRPYNPSSNKEYWTGIKINSSQNNDSLKYFEVYNAYKGIRTLTNTTLTGAKIFNCYYSGLSVELTSNQSNLNVNNIILKNDSIGIDINNSNNIKIDWAKVDSCLGDGIAINQSQNVKINNSLINNNKGHGIFSDLSSWTLTNSRVRLSSYFGISNSRSTLNMSYCDIDTNNWSGVMIGAGSTANITYSSIFSNQGSGYEISDWYLDKNFNTVKFTNPIVSVGYCNIYNNHQTFYNTISNKINLNIPLISGWGNNYFDFVHSTPFWEIPFGSVYNIELDFRCFAAGGGVCNFYLKTYGPNNEITSSNNFIYPSSSTIINQIGANIYSKTDIYKLEFSIPAYAYQFEVETSNCNAKLQFGKYELNSTVNSAQTLSFQNNYWGVVTGVDSLINDVNGTNVNYSGFSPILINTAHSTIFNNNIIIDNFPLAVISTNTNNSYICGTSGNLNLLAPSGNGLNYTWYYNNTNISYTNQTYLATTTGNYSVNIANSSGCNFTTPNFSVSQITITSPVISTSNNLVGCFGDTIKLTSTIINGASYQYYNGSNNINNGNSNVYKATTTGSYYVVVTDSVSQCQATSNTLTTSIIPYPTITASTQGLPIINCSGGYKDINTTTTGTNLHYQWKINNVVIPNSDTSIYSATQQGAYTVVVTNGNGCKDTSTVINITNNNLPLPTITLNSNDTTICNGSAFTIIANGCVSYNWTPSASLNTTSGSTVIATPTANTTYVVTGIGSNGCSASKSINISLISTVPSTPGTITGTTNICQGQGLLTYTVPLINDATSYSWTLPNGVSGNSTTNSINANFASNAQSGNITVKGKNTCGFGNESALAVIVNPIPSAPTVTNSISYCQNASTSPLTAQGSNLLWYSSSIGGTGSGTAPTPSTANVGTTNYYVSQSVNSCESSRSQIAVTTNAIPIIPIVTNNVTYCQNVSATQLTRQRVQIYYGIHLQQVVQEAEQLPYL